MRMLSAAILLHIPPERSNSPFYQNLDVTFGLRDKIFFCKKQMFCRPIALHYAHRYTFCVDVCRVVSHSAREP